MSTPLLATRLYGAGLLNGATEQEEFLGQCRLASVRVRDNGKGPPLRDCFVQTLQGRLLYF